MKKNRVVFLLVALVAVTALLAWIHLNTRVTTPEGVLRVEAAGQVEEIPWDQMGLTAVQGTLVNGKGEERTIDMRGVLLRDVLEYAGITVQAQVSVTAEDEYRATVTAEEIGASGKVYLAEQEDGGIQLVVFGDSNSKRNVSDVVRLVVE